jgi:hypothetical protein
MTEVDVRPRWAKQNEDGIIKVQDWKFPRARRGSSRAQAVASQRNVGLATRYSIVATCTIK